MTKSYSVSISNPGLSGDGNGFIDSKRIEQYNAPSITSDQAVAKKRANIRYNALVMGVGMVANPQVSNIDATGASATAEASEFNIDLTFVNEEAIAIIRDGERLEGMDALKRLVAETMIEDRTSTIDYYHATKLAAVSIVNIDALASDVSAAESLITITEL